MTATSTTYAPAPVTTGRPTLPRLMRSEWIKLRTLRSTVWCFALVFLLLAGFSALFTPFVVDQLRTQLSLPGLPSDGPAPPGGSAASPCRCSSPACSACW